MALKCKENSNYNIKLFPVLIDWMIEYFVYIRLEIIFTHKFNHLIAHYDEGFKIIKTDSQFFAYERLLYYGVHWALF